MTLTILTPGHCRHRGGLSGTGASSACLVRTKLPRQRIDLRIVPPSCPGAQDTAAFITSGSESDARWRFIRDLHWDGINDSSTNRTLRRHLELAGVCQTRSIELFDTELAFRTAIKDWEETAVAATMIAIEASGADNTIAIIPGVLAQAFMSKLTGQKLPFYSDVLGYCQGYTVAGSLATGWDTIPIR